jgi:hypothetical protein
VNGQIDDNNCGACGNVCGVCFTCVSGACVFEGVPGLPAARCGG